MGGRSRRKGKVGERELAAVFREHGFTARRGQQFQGDPGSPDVIVEELPWLHIECKRSERLKLYEAMNQSRCDAGAEQLPMVAYRANHHGWLAILELLEGRSWSDRLCETVEATEAKVPCGPSHESADHCKYR